MPLKTFVSAGLLVLSAVPAALGAAGRTYQFGHWTMTITPKPSATTPRAVDSTPVRGRAEKRESMPSSPRAVAEEPRLHVVPASYQQSASDEQPTSAAEVTPIEIPAPIPPAPSPILNTVVIPPPPTEIGSIVTEVQPLRLPIITPRPADLAPLPIPQSIPAQTAQYSDIYYSIPFNRAEYNAYPSYRHDATMEFMFGKMRPTVIQRGTTHVYQDGWGGYGGYGYGLPYTPYYPFTYGLRIHSSR